MGKEISDKIIHGLSRFHHQHDLAGSFQRLYELLNRPCANNVLPFRPSLHKVVDFFDRPVENGDGVSPALHIEHEVLPHHRQPDQSYISLLLHSVSLSSFS